MRVVITGIGAVTSLGITFRDTWQAIIQGKTGIGPCTKIDTSALPWKVAGEIKESKINDFFSDKQRRRLDPFVQYAIIAAREAVADAAIPPPENTAIIIGTSRAGITLLEETIRSGHLSAYLMPATTANMACSQVAESLKIKGHSVAISAACASGAMAVLEAFRLIKDGYYSMVIAGASDAPITRVCLEGYGRMGVLSKNTKPEASRPFDRKRDGFVLSEGACIMVLETLKSAEKRGARIYAEILSAQSLTSIVGQTRPDLDDEIGVMKNAIFSAGLNPEDIDFINTHSTSTVLGDRVEAEAIHRVFGKKMVVTANKSQTGHMLGASSALEIALSAMSIHYEIVPPTINTDDPEFSISLFNKPLKRAVKTVLKNSFGFGGINVAMVLSKAR